jgi:hypothetical protein
MASPARPSREHDGSKEVSTSLGAPPRSAHALLLVAAVLLPFDDLGIWPVGGPLASSPAWLPLSLLAIVLGRWRWSRTRAAQPRILWILVAVLGYGLVLSLGSLQFLPAQALGEDLIVKGVKVGVTLSLWMMCVLAGWLAWQYLLPTLRIALVIALTITALSAFLVAVGGPLDTSQLLHEGVNIQQRVRGARFEASSLGACLLVLSGYLALTLPRSAALASQLVLLPATVLLTASRGSLVAAALLAALTCAAWLRKPDDPIRPAAHRAAGVSAVVAGLGGTFALGWVVRSEAWLSLGLGGGGSDATRSLWGDVAISTTVEHPLGTGFSGLPWIREALIETLRRGSEHFSTPELRELSMLAHATGDQALAPKTLPAIVVMYLGLPGLALLVYALYRLGVATGAALAGGRSGLVIASGSLIVVSTTYFAGISTWEQATLIGSLCAAAASTAGRRPPADPRSTGPSAEATHIASVQTSASRAADPGTRRRAPAQMRDRAMPSSLPHHEHHTPQKRSATFRM